MEQIARAHLKRDLSQLQRAFKLAYELAVEAPTLPSRRVPSDMPVPSDMTVAALFLKRALSDLRAVWLLLQTGYTSQAAAVAASLWENSLASACVCGHPSRADEVLNNPNELPWRPKQLARLHATDVTAKIASSAERNRQFELRWREHYGPYKWLCGLKHPTLRSVRHDSKSTVLDEDKQFVVMAMPDLRPDDRGIKLGVATQALQHILAASSRFTDVSDCEDTKRYRAWIERWKEAGNLVIEHQKGVDRPALPLDDDAFFREYAAIRDKQEGKKSGGDL
jgi:hypothetical protein